MARTSAAEKALPRALRTTKGWYSLVAVELVQLLREIDGHGERLEHRRLAGPLVAVELPEGHRVEGPVADPHPLVGPWSWAKLSCRNSSGQSIKSDLPAQFHCAKRTASAPG